MSDLTISVTIADRSYRLTIARDEEEQMRKSVAGINKKVKRYSENYAFNDKQDLLAMVALEEATNAIKSSQEARSQEVGLRKELDELDKVLSVSLD